MAKNKRKRTAKVKDDDLVKVDIYYIPGAQADMYIALREAVISEMSTWFEEHNYAVQRVSDEEQGETLVALNQAQEEVARYYLSPSNISEAQVARDKDQLEKYMQTHVLKKS